MIRYVCDGCGEERDYEKNMAPATHPAGWERVRYYLVCKHCTDRICRNLKESRERVKLTDIARKKVE